MYKVITPELEKIILANYHTKTAKELGQELDINSNTIKGVWQRNGLTGKNTFSPDKKEFTRKYLSLPIIEVANYYKKDRHTITKFAKRIGIYKKPEKLLTKKQEEEIANRYNSDTSNNLAKEFQVSSSKISQIWHQYGLVGKHRLRYPFNEKFFERIDTEEKAYWLGFIAADGCVYAREKGEPGLRITLQKSDASHLQKFMDAVHCNKPLSYFSRLSPKGDVHYYATCELISEQMFQDLSRQNIVPRKTKKILWPSLASNELYIAYIRGYFDGDGSISKKIEKNTMYKTNISIAGYLDNLQYFQDFLLKYDIPSSFTIDARNKNTSEQGAPFVSLNFTNKKTKNDFLHLMYDNTSIYLNRKYELANIYFECFKQNPCTWTLK